MEEAISNQPKLIWLNNKTTYTAIISKEAVKDHGFTDVNHVTLEVGSSELVIRKQ